MSKGPALAKPLTDTDASLEDIVKLALIAFHTDENYVCNMIFRARAIIAKRELGSARVELLNKYGIPKKQKFVGWNAVEILELLKTLPDPKDVVLN